MWRVLTPKTVMRCKLCHRTIDLALANTAASNVRHLSVSCRRHLADRLPVPEEEERAQWRREQREQQERQEENFWPYVRTAALISSALAFTGYIALYRKEEDRFWNVDWFPFLTPKKPKTEEPAFNADEIENLLGLKVEVKAPKNECANNSTSFIDVADNTVKGMSINNALENDLQKEAAKKREAVEKLLNPQEAKAEAANAIKDSDKHKENIKKIQDKRQHEGPSLLQAGVDSTQLLLGNLRNPTQQNIDERNKKENERHQKRMEEKERKDSEYLRKQKEKEENKAALALEHQRKQEAEEREAAEAILTKIRKNKEFEGKASKGLTHVMELSNTAIKLTARAVTTCREHSARLKEAMDCNLEEEALKLWPRVHELNDTRTHRVAEAHKVTKEAEDSIVDYLEFIEETKKDPDTKDNKAISSYKRQIQELAYQVKTVHDRLKSQESVSSIMKHYFHMMKKDKADFIRELQAIVPEIKLGEKGLNLNEEELNALLAHAQRRIFQLKRQLTEQQLLERQRLEDALCEQKKTDMKEANVKIGKELDRQYDELILEKEAELIAQARKFETEMRLKLAKQTSEHRDHLQDMLGLQQKKLMEQFDLALRERLIHERHMFINQISQNMAKVRGLEAALEERANLQSVVTHVQDLMSSALCLMHAVAHDVDCKGEEFDIIRIDEPLKRCYEAAQNDPFIEGVLMSISNVAAERGIYSISSLEKRFEDVHAALKRNLNSSRMPLFGSSDKPKYADSCENVDLEAMTPQELVVQAKYCMDKKCLAEAVRCLVALSGVPRTIAQDWIEEARLVLEVRQASEVLLAFANSRGMGTVF